MLNTLWPYSLLSHTTRDLGIKNDNGNTDVMYFVQDAHSFWNWLYFVLLIVVSLYKPIIYNHLLEESNHGTAEVIEIH